LIKDKIDRNYEVGKDYHQAKDMLHATHSLVEVDGPFDIYNMAIEIPPEQMTPKLKSLKVDESRRILKTMGHYETFKS